MTPMSALPAFALLLLSGVAQAQGVGPTVTLAPADGSVIQAGTFQTLQVNYSSAASTVDSLRVRIFVGAEEWTGRFAVRPTNARMTLSTSDRIVGGALTVTAGVPDLDGGVTTASASYTVQPKLTGSASSGRVAEAIQVTGVGLDPQAGANSLQFAASNGTIEVPFDSVDVGALRGTVTSPDGAIS